MTDVAVEAPVIEQATEPAELIPDLRALFTFSAWVHVGAAADVCEKVDESTGRNECDDAGHVHVWCRLPNGLQMRVIAEKARAAKARRARELRDDTTDSYAILEDEITGIADLEEKEPIVDMLVGVDWYKHYLRARGEIGAMEPEREDDDDGPFAHIDEDQQRMIEILAMPEDEQPKDERETLDKHIQRFQSVLEAKVAEFAEPERAALFALEMPALVERLRRHLIREDAMAVFQHEYALNEWLLCTTTAPHSPRRWLTVQDMEGEPPELIEAVKTTYERLERDQRELAQGKAF